MNKSLSILKIEEDTVVDGPGFRTAIYAAGCTNACPGCHNPESWDIQNGTRIPINDILAIVKKNEMEDVTFTGGDPLFQAEVFTDLAKRIKRETGKGIWCYTGYAYEFIERTPRLAQILPYIDVLVDGRFIRELRDEHLLFRGSSNQRLINVKESLRSGKVRELIYKPYPELPMVV